MATEKADLEPEETIERAKRVLRAHHSLLQYATKHGVSHNRWRKVVNSMIEKDPGDPRIHRLRVIHLYEADYNLLLGISGHGRWYPKQRISCSSMKSVTAVGQGDPQPILLLWRNDRSLLRASQEQTKSSFTTTRHRATTESL
jgi:hypothetical protein